jgi:meso-butanediol dehydrogenase/(S,S)-butanediol dehydrogenase/diacetyl reductase
MSAPVGVVTGASRGLGRGIAVALAEAGHDLVLGFTADVTGVEQTAEAVRSTGRRAVTVQGDVRDPATARLLASAACENLGDLDVWVNNAGVSVLAPVESTPPAELERMLAVNVLGTLHGIQAAAPALRARGGGRIVNLASDLGVQGGALLGAYAATKFAVVGLTQSAALELAAARVTVNAVCPGTVETDMVADEWRTQAALTGRSVETVRASYLEAIPFGRFCTPADVGAVVAFLAGPSAAYVTGQSLCVNGGSVLH